MSERVEALLDWLITDKLYKNYIKSLENKSDSYVKYLPTEEGWEEYKKENHPLYKK